MLLQFIIDELEHKRFLSHPLPTSLCQLLLSQYNNREAVARISRQPPPPSGGGRAGGVAAAAAGGGGNTPVPLAPLRSSPEGASVEISHPIQILRLFPG